MICDAARAGCHRPRMESGHGDQRSAVPTRSVAGGVCRAVRHGGQVLSRTVPLALAVGFPLPILCEPFALALSSRRPGVLPMLRLPASDHPRQRHAVRRHEAAVAHLVRGDLSADLHQDQSVRAGTQAPSGRALSHRLATQAQDHAGHDGARRNPPTGGFRASGRCVSWWRTQRRQGRPRGAGQAAVRDRGEHRRRTRTSNRSGPSTMPRSWTGARGA